MATLTIGAAAKRAGVKIDTVRYYERVGLLADPPRKANGYRQYNDDIVQRITFIKRAQRLGFTLHEAAELLALHAPVAPCAEVERLIAGKVAEIEERIAALTAVRDTLVQAVARCERECETGCTVLLADAPSTLRAPDSLAASDADLCCDVTP